jgi:hypothetical protein
VGCDAMLTGKKLTAFGRLLDLEVGGGTLFQNIHKHQSTWHRIAEDLNLLLSSVHCKGYLWFLIQRNYKVMMSSCYLLTAKGTCQTSFKEITEIK